MRGHNICFCGEIRKIIFQLSSILPLIWSSAYYPVGVATITHFTHMGPITHFTLMGDTKTWKIEQLLYKG